MSYTLFFFLPAGEAFDAAALQSRTGLNPVGKENTVLNRHQVYPVVEAADPYNTDLYTTVLSYTVVETEAVQTWTATPRPLSTAKANGKRAERTRASNNTAAIRLSSGYSSEAMTAAAAQPQADRGSDIESVIALSGSQMDRLDANLQAIDAAKKVATIAKIVDAPDLVMNTGRGKASEFDMNLSHFPTINLGGVVESDLELFIPVADTILKYRTDLPSPSHFDMGSTLFTAENQQVVVRIAATGVVVGEFTCPNTGSGSNLDIDIFTAQS